MTASGRESIVVHIVDDDPSVREGFARLLRSAGLDPRPYDSADDFLQTLGDAPRACILLDVTLPHLAECQVQSRLRERGITLPVIAISARDDGAWARSLGARLFLRKPVDDQALLDAIDWVIGEGGGLPG